MSLEEGRRVVLRDGREAVIRVVRPDDADALHESWVAMARDGRGMVADESEMTIERVEKSITRYLMGDWSGENGVFLVGEVEGRVVADATVHRMGARRVHHVAVLGIGVHPSYQGIGLGRAMMDAPVAWAERVGVERLELAVRADNRRAIALYESMGFECESVRKRFVKLDDGTYLDDWVMVRWLEERKA